MGHRKENSGEAGRGGDAGDAGAASGTASTGIGGGGDGGGIASDCDSSLAVRRSRRRAGCAGGSAGASAAMRGGPRSVGAREVTKPALVGATAPSVSPRKSRMPFSSSA
jgi:hypothetical protein